MMTRPKWTLAKTGGAHEKVNAKWLRVLIASFMLFIGIGVGAEFGQRPAPHVTVPVTVQPAPAARQLPAAPGTVKIRVARSAHLFTCTATTNGGK